MNYEKDIQDFNYYDFKLRDQVCFEFLTGIKNANMS